MFAQIMNKDYEMSVKPDSKCYEGFYKDIALHLECLTLLFCEK